MAPSIVILCGMWLVCVVLKVVNRLYLHPLSGVPGRPLAAVSQWYDFYYNVIRNGIYSKQWPRLHTKYSVFTTQFRDELC
jgi:hypothetical protein